MAADTQVRRVSAGPTRPATGRGRRPPGGTARVASPGAPGAAAAEGAAQGPPRSGFSRLRVRPGPRPRAAQTEPGLEESGAPAPVSAAGPGRALPDPDVAEVHLRETRLHFPEAPEPGGAAVPKLTVQRMFPGRLLGAGRTAGLCVQTG